jgi:hypothetical protein
MVTGQEGPTSLEILLKRPKARCFFSLFLQSGVKAFFPGPLPILNSAPNPHPTVCNAKDFLFLQGVGRNQSRLQPPKQLRTPLGSPQWDFLVTGKLNRSQPVILQSGFLGQKPRASGFCCEMLAGLTLPLRGGWSRKGRRKEDGDCMPSESEPGWP